uniref:Intracellular proteinase inhibitor BsuPI domain-containing protein n=1 Tax=Candidatus Methanogaster sp. ANME-2c ERB4 TaxID=2759911 RepID=A0A7G9Y3G9_9EURY|nr:hypothetical protein MMHALIEK_00028 [Methanosarcinales archaeon ANME-2c ERB4]
MKTNNKITGRNIAAIIITLTIVCSMLGCLGGDKPSEQKPTTPWVAPERPYVKLVDTSQMKLGVPSDATITIFNNGNEIVTKEKIVMTATAVKMDDWKVNLGMKSMSAEEKTETYTLEFDEQIESGESCALCAEFNLPAKVETKIGKVSIAGTYHVVIKVYANNVQIGEKIMDVHLT